ncbi:MAG: protein BatD [Ignavibacteriae bacterium]|nr:protein BatD [Ignavibacteriota bacterium]
MKGIHFFLLFGIIFFQFEAQSQFTASVDRNPVPVGEQFQVTFSLSNLNGSNFRAPGFKGFTVLMGPSTSQQMSFVNGQMSRSLSYTYILQADAEGSFQIGSATIEADGKTLRTNPININVTKGSPQQKQTQSQGGQDQSQGNLNKQANDVIAKNLFLRLNVSKKEVYQGEQIIATYVLYVHPDLRLVQLVPSQNAPTFTGFWTQDIDIGKLQFHTENVNGVAFNAAVVKKVILIPQQTGKLNIEPFIFETVCRLIIQNQNRKRRSIFDDFFSMGPQYQDFKYNASSGAVSINVKPLPPGAPPDFNGGVGNLSMKAWVDKPKTKTNEPVNLKIQISGNGNLKLIEPFDLKLPPDIETYDPKVNDNISVSGSGVSGSRTFEYLLIPRHAGEYKIEPVGFSYFDLNSRQYKSLSSQEFVLQVEQGTGDESIQSVSGVRKEDIKYIGKDIRFIKNLSGELSKSSGKFLGSGGFYILVFMPLILFLLFFIYFKRQQKLEGNQALLKNKRATKMARKRLQTAKLLLTDSSEDKFYEEVSHALWGYLSDKLTIPISDLNKDTASYSLSQRNINEESIQHCMSTIDYCEFARFARSTNDVSKQNVYDDAVKVITDLEGILR